jgi:branched-chain amino acid aminotransferase
MHPSMLALHYGQSIFEGMKATKGDDGQALLFRPKMHARRMNASARRMYMPEIPEEMFLQAIHSLVDIDSDWIPPQEGSALYIRPFMFATDEYIGVSASNKYTFIIMTLPVGPYYNKPVSLLAEHHYVRAAVGGVGQAKTCGNYAASLLPANIAKQKGYDQVLWLDAKEFKYVQEVGTMNIFFVFEDEVVTPATDGAILKGITRNSIINILKEKDIKVTERKISIDEVMERGKDGSLKEIFGSGTAAVVANVHKLTNNDDTITFTEDDFQLSKELKNYIDKLRNGKIKDEFGWIVPVASESVTA